MQLTKQRQHFGPSLFFAALTLIIFTQGCALKTRPQFELLPEATQATLTARATVRVADAYGEEKGGRAVILAKRPDMFRIEVSGPFGQTALLFLGGRSGIYLYHGEGVMRYLEGVPSEEIVDVLFGSQSWPEEADFQGSKKEGVSYSVSRDSFGRLSTLMRVGKDETLTVTMDDYKRLSETELPFMLTVKTEAERLTVNYHSLELGREIDDSLFEGP